MNAFLFDVDTVSVDVSPGDELSALAREHYERKVMREARRIAKGSSRKAATAEHLRVVLDRLEPRHCPRSIPF
jgi:hypothetical protein